MGRPPAARALNRGDVSSAVAPDTLGLEHFAPLLGERFELRHAGGALSAELMGARALGASGAAQRAPFSLLFKAPPGTSLPQQIFSVAHSRLAAADIFLVPVAAGDDGVTYEAVFS